MELEDFPPLPSSSSVTPGVATPDASRSKMADVQEGGNNTNLGPGSQDSIFKDPKLEEVADLQHLVDHEHVLSSDELEKELETLSPVIAVKTSGDLLINIPDALHPTLKTLYRVSVPHLRGASQYFDRLLDPDKFAEGARVKKAHEQLEQDLGGLDKLESSSLPIVEIQDVDPTIPRRGSGSNFSQQDVVTTFFRILHGKSWSQGSVSVPHLACVAVLADRFDAIATFREGVRKTDWIDLFRKSFNKLPEATEEILRQKLLLAIFLKEYRLWSSLSAKLITQGSCRWDDSNETTPEDDLRGLWWDLPCGVEDELLTRRLCVLDTLNSIQTHLVNSYIPTLGRPYRQQCRMGYGNSPQCDSFQLGEALRFFSRVGTLHLSLSPLERSTSTSSVSSGNAHDILHNLAGAPSHQIDPYHRHCGIRLRIRSMIETMERHWMLGICGYCWEDRRSEISWQTTTPPEKVYIIEGVVAASHCSFDLGLPPPETKFSFSDTCRCASSQRILSKLLFTSLRKEWEHQCEPGCEFYETKEKKPSWRSNATKSVRVALSRYDS